MIDGRISHIEISPMKLFKTDSEPYIPLPEDVVAAKALKVMGTSRWNKHCNFGYGLVLIDRCGTPSVAFNVGNEPVTTFDEALSRTFDGKSPLYAPTAANDIKPEWQLLRELTAVEPLVRSLGTTALPLGVRSSETFVMFAQPTLPVHGRTLLDDTFLVD